MRTSLALAVALALRAGAPASATAQHGRAETWAITDRAPCEGLTIGWAVPRAELAERVGAGLTPAAGPAPGTGLLLLFVAKCPGSTIAGRLTGEFVTAHVIIPIEPPPIASDPVARGIKGWIAIPATFGDSTSPVRTLFGRHGFVVHTGHATLSVNTSVHPQRARLTLSTPDGELDATGTFADSARRFASITGLVGTTHTAHALAHGPEHSRRQSGEAATVSARGTTILSGLHPADAPVAVLDTDFSWSFTFAPVTPSRRR